MSTRSLTSKNNPVVKTVRLLATQARRAPAELTLVEGVRSVEEVLRANIEISTVLISDNFGDSERGLRLREVLVQSGLKIYQIPEALFRSLSDVKASQGILALVRIPARKLITDLAADRPLLLCAAGIQDPGNLGTLIRAAAAAGASMVCTLSGTVSVRNPKTVRASAGAVFHIPFIEELAPEGFLEFCRRRSIPVLRSSAHEGNCYFREDLTGPCAILLGNEGSGVDRAAWAAGLRSVHIPMAPGAESLNVAVAGAILMFEALRQRTSRPS